jgi:hypothetical protein
MNFSYSGLEVVEGLVKARLSRIESNFRTAVEGAKDGIRIRTQGGFDIESNLFKDYSKSWAKKRLRAGKGIDRVDLTFSGDMFNSLSVRFEEQTYKLSATIYFKSPEQAQKAKWNQVDHKRPFFGLSVEQKRSIIKQVRSA